MPYSPFLPARSPAAPSQPVWCNLIIWQRPLTWTASCLIFNASSISKTGNKRPRESISSDLSVSPNICNSLTKGLKLHPLPFGENGARRGSVSCWNSGCEGLRHSTARNQPTSEGAWGEQVPTSAVWNHLDVLPSASRDSCEILANRINWLSLPQSP